jgi:hypothetical protein
MQNRDVVLKTNGINKLYPCNSQTMSVLPSFVWFEAGIVFDPHAKNMPGRIQ